MTQTPNLKIDKHQEGESGTVRFNEAIQDMDVLVQMSVIDKDLTTPPGSPSEGDRYIVPAGATGDWAGEDGNIAGYYGGTWQFWTPNEGFIVWVEDEVVTYRYRSSAWAFEGTAANRPLVVVRVTSPLVGNEFPLTFGRVPLTIGKVLGVKSPAGTSCTISLHKSTDRSLAGTSILNADLVITSSTTGTSTTSFNDPSVSIDEFVFGKVNAVAGSPDWVEIYVSYDET